MALIDVEDLNEMWKVGSDTPRMRVAITFEAWDEIFRLAQLGLAAEDKTPTENSSCSTENWLDCRNSACVMRCRHEPK